MCVNGPSEHHIDVEPNTQIDVNDGRIGLKVYEAKHKKKKDKMLSKSKKIKQCLFKKNASKRKDHQLTVKAKNDPELLLFEEVEDKWDMGKKLALLLKMMMTLWGPRFKLQRPGLKGP